MTTTCLEYQMTDPTLVDEISKNSTTILTGIGGVGAIGLWLRKYFKDMGLADQSRDLEANKINGADDIIKILREEVGRLADMNKLLSTEIKALQEEIVALRGENTDLRSEIGDLNEQIKRLTIGAKNACEACELEKND